MPNRKLKYIAIFSTFLIVGIGFGIYSIFHPFFISYILRNGEPLSTLPAKRMKVFQLPKAFERGLIQKVAENVYLGPMPTDEEFKALPDFQVTDVISLLNQSVPFEKEFIRHELKLADSVHLKIQNYPMSFIPLRTAQNEEIARQIVQYIAQHPNEHFYIHCFLGRDRVSVVADALEQYMRQKGNSIRK
ncbi:MAG: hypothetical protein ACP5MI_08295 [Candidatus Kryptoniota bacterium]